MRKRILLLYITDVSGHRSAALAIEKALKQLSPDVDITAINAFKYTNPISEKIVNRLYTTVIKKTPKIWDYMYDNPKVKRSLEKLKEFVHRNNSPKLQRLFDTVKPDIVVCTQAFPCGMVADYKRWTGSKLPLVGVLTDFVPHSYWVYDQVDHYITPAEDVSQRLMKKGVPQEKIHAYGIPFDPAFSQSVDARLIKQKLRLDAQMKTILIMGGGQGLGPIKTIFRSLEKVRRPLQEIIVCGTNKKLYKQLSRKTGDSKHKILLCGYVNNVNELMSASDLIVTKPGGITTAEALSKGLPMIIIKPLPGQEMNNTQFLINQQAAVKLDRATEIYSVVDGLLEEPDRLSSLTKAAGKIGKPTAALDIARFVLEKCPR
ncbi:MAG: MGDG synthase family glycosyltransferase [Deltaproteobacteria bacterium]